jgi:hypothetical protein
MAKTGLNLIPNTKIKTRTQNMQNKNSNENLI